MFCQAFILILKIYSVLVFVTLDSLTLIPPLLLLLVKVVEAFYYNSKLNAGIQYYNFSTGELINLDN